jgi:hypothetical protein
MDLRDTERLRALTPNSESIYRHRYWLYAWYTLFAPIGPKTANLSARKPIAACLRPIAQLLDLARANNQYQNLSSQREQFEMKIASQANSAQVSCFKETSAGLGRLMARVSRGYRSGRLCRGHPKRSRSKKQGKK